MESRLYHFSEDPSIERFVPHVPASNPTQVPSVWAIDPQHAPLYWFPRACPRVSAYLGPGSDREAFRQAFVTTADRVHAVESRWLSRIRSVVLFQYEFSAEHFMPWPDAPGHWIARTEVVPLAVQRVGDLLERHVASEIDLRLVPSLEPMRALAIDDRWQFSIVRWSNAVAD